MSAEPCSFNDCERQTYCKKLCQGHYVQQHRGQPLRTLRADLTPSQRFWRKVDKSGDCWLWTGTLNNQGYGMFAVNRHMGLAHRFAYRDVRGEIPAGHHLDHMCWTPACVNPAHLRPATNSQNVQNPKGLRSDNKSGVRGVHWIESRQKWRAEATVNGKSTSFGYFDDPEDAEPILRAWRREHMPYSIQDQGVRTV